MSTVTTQKPPSDAKPVSPLDQARKFNTELNKLRAAIERAKQNYAKAEENLIAAKRALADASAKALAEGHSDQGLPEAKALSDAYDRLEQSKLALLGCQNRLNAADPKPILEPLRAELERYREAEITRFIEETYQPAAQLFLDSLHVGQALASGLGIKANLDNPDLSASSRRLAEALHKVPTAGNWRSDSVALERFEENKELHIMVQSLERHQSELQTAKERKAHTKPPHGAFDADGRYVVTDPTLLIRGVAFPQGSIVTQYDMGASGVALLARLVAVGKLRLLGEEQLIS